MPQVVQFEVTGRDSEQLQRFYGALFDWQFHDTGTAGYARTLGVDSGLPGAIGPAWDGGAGQLTIYVEVADLDLAPKRTEKLGGRVLPATPPPDRSTPVESRGKVFEVPQAGIRFGFVADPEGHVIALCRGMGTGLDAFISARQLQKRSAVSKSHGPVRDYWP